ncbi:MAG: hypothetical protein KGR26_03290 [Cyanobacteria bacterium REEB65]|nr:hypothetical protein [Cyanobacteria bacterium REEB65]
MNYRLAAAVLSVTVLAGCGAPPAGRSLYPMPAAATALGTSAAKASLGSVELVFTDASYHTQATAADVSALQITITPSTGAPITQTMTKGGNAEIDNIPPGPATVAVVALDSNGNNIGSASQTVDIVAGQVATVSLSIQLVPTVIPVATSGVAIHIGLIDGATVSATPSVPVPVTSPSPVASPLPSIEDRFDTPQNWQGTFVHPSYSNATPSVLWTLTPSATGSLMANPGASNGNVNDPGTYLFSLSDCDTTSLAKPTVSFDYDNFNPLYFFKSTSFSFEYSTDGTTWTKAWSASDEQSSWSHVTVSVPKAAGMSFRFDFGYTYYLGTDEMSAPWIQDLALTDAANN